MRIKTVVVAAMLVLIPADVFGRIKLAALPVRERVEIELANPDYTLVEEERIVPLLQSTAEMGNNRIDFSWSNVHIDKDSIQFRPIAIGAGEGFRPLEDGEVTVINVAYPPNENALVWEVYARQACAVKVRVSYLIGDLTRTFAYRALVDKDETLLTLRKYIQLRNYSGEGFGDAGVWAGFGPDFLRPVGGQEDIKMLLAKFDEAVVAKTFTFDWFRHGPLNPDKPLASKVLMHYELTNDAAGGLGVFPLLPGKVRIFIQDGRGGEAFLGEDWAPLTPLDEHMRLYLGESRDVVCVRKVQTNTRHVVRGNLFHQEIVLRYEIQNFKDKPATLDVVEQLNRLAREYGGDPHGDVEWDLGPQTSSNVEFVYEDGRALPKLRIALPARPKDTDAEAETIVVLFHLTLKNLW